MQILIELYPVLDNKKIRRKVKDNKAGAMEFEGLDMENYQEVDDEGSNPKLENGMECGHCKEAGVRSEDLSRINHQDNAEEDKAKSSEGEKVSKNHDKIIGYRVCVY